MTFLRNAFAGGIFAVWAFGAVLLPVSANAIVATVENELNHSEAGAVLEITNIKGKGIPPNLRVLVMPGERKQVSRRNVYSFVVNRVYADRKERFEVLCPDEQRLKESVSLTLDNVNADEVAGGCVIARKGRWTVEEGFVWEKKRRKIPFIP